MSEQDLITLEELKLSIDCTKDMIDMMFRKKYACDDTEKTYSDAVARMCRILRDRFGSGPEATYAGDTVDSILSILESELFIPAGSIVAGLTDNGTSKHSLSNCYVLDIPHDSIEDIADCIKNACRTYSYRGGVGIDITVLRPNNTLVNNAARTSSGAVSFMPMISQANATIGTNGRRAAMMISMDINHPDIMEFLWCKADPESVFHRDHMSKDVSARYLKEYLNTNTTIPQPDRDALIAIVDNGRLPDVNTANISIKVTDEFMKLAIDPTKDPAHPANTPWVTKFPDIHADKEFYNKNWKGDYAEWEAMGGKLIEYDYHQAFITKRNYKRFIGRIAMCMTPLHPTDPIVEQWTVLSEERILEELARTGGSWKAKLQNPSPKQILRQIAETNHMRNDPGLLFWDRHVDWTMGTHIDKSLKPITTNPCAEQSMAVGASCLLGAHVLYRYVRNPYTKDAYFDMRAFFRNVERAYLLMNMFSTINEDMHPLKIQRDMEKYGKRIGIEFTGLADMLAAMDMYYDSGDAIEFVGYLMHAKAQIELKTNVYLAHVLGPCEACDPRTNTEGLEALYRSKFLQHIINPDISPWLWFKNYNKQCQERGMYCDYPENWTPSFITSKPPIEAIHLADIPITGLRNSGMNTVGPAGTLSMMAGYCSSGIEPIFDLFQNRTTRVGDQPSYSICHLPIIQQVYDDMVASGRTRIDIETIKTQYTVSTVDTIDYGSRIYMQNAVQLSCDSSISSTINLPEDISVDAIANIYAEAYLADLKGITTYRDGSMDGVINHVKKDDKEESSTDTSKVDALQDTGDNPKIVDGKVIANMFPQYARGEIMPLSDDIPARRLEVSWEGHRIYLVVSMDDFGNPVELLPVSLPYEVSTDKSSGQFNPEDYLQKLSMWNSITRLISIGLRVGTPPEEITKQLSKSTSSITDLTSIVTRVLNKVIHPTYRTANTASPQRVATTSKMALCPDCGQHSVIHQGGCANCTNPDCAWSKCM